MNKHMTAGTLICLIALMTLIGCSSAPTEEYVFGAVLPLTGPAAFYGAFSQAGINLAIEDINAAGGINGRPVRVIFEDGPNAQAASSAANKLVNLDKVDAIFSSTTAMSGATAPMAEVAGVPMIYAAASTSFAHNKTFVFKDYPGADEECEIAMKRMIADGHTITALIGANAEYTTLCEEGARKIRAPTISERYNPGDTDLKTQMTKIKNSGATAILVSMIAYDCPNMFKEMRELGLNATIYIMFQGVGCGNPSNTEHHADLMQGAYGVDTYIDEQSPAFVAFKNRLTEKGWTTEIKGSAMLYDMVLVMAQAYEGCEDKRCVTDTIRSTSEFSFVTGPIRYDGGQLVKREMMLLRLEGKEWKKV